MIPIKPSPTADTRTCDFANTEKRTLLNSSKQHITDVQRALAFFGRALNEAAIVHDDDKVTDIDGFHRDFVTGFTKTTWWDAHRALNRHHLLQPDGIRDNVNLIDVLDFIADCVMAGMARSGSVYPLVLSPELLERAFQNTVELLKAEVVVSPFPVDQHPGAPGAEDRYTMHVEYGLQLGDGTPEGAQAAARKMARIDGVEGAEEATKP